MSGRFIRAFSDPDVSKIVNEVERRLDDTGYPYILIMDVGGVLKNVAGPGGPTLVELIDALNRGDYLSHVLEQIVKEEHGKA